MVIFILAGGFGTRLQSIVSDVPKPLASIGNKTFLDYQILQLRNFFPNEEIYLLTHYKSDKIENYYKNSCNITVVKEDIPLGTGGSIKNAIETIGLSFNDKLLVLNGDTYLEANFSEFVSSATESVSILCSFQEDCSRYGSLEINNNFISSFIEKKENVLNSYINAGCYFFNNLEFFDHNRIKDRIFSIENEFSNYLIKNKITAYKYNGIFIDIGIPSDYKKMKEYIGNNYEYE